MFGEIVLEEIISYLLPIAALQLLLQVIALISLLKRNHVNLVSKKVWIVIILLGGILGSIVYFVFRGEDNAYSSED